MFRKLEVELAALKEVTSAKSGESERMSSVVSKLTLEKDGLAVELRECKDELDRVIEEKIASMKAFSEHLMTIKESVRGK